MAVWRVARFALTGTWLVARWDDFGDMGSWALERRPLVAAALAAVFVAVFVSVRAVIPWLERRAQ